MMFQKKKIDSNKEVSNFGFRISDFQQRGVTTLLVVAFMGVFLMVMGTITSYVFEQAKYGRALYAREQALHVAEAGLEYYKWFLTHNPSIMTAGSGLVSPYTYTVKDPEGSTVGSASITASASLQCGRVQWVDLTSTGTAINNPTFPRVLQARYMHPSSAEYSNIFNAAVWYGSGSSITGPLYSSGGIRMDGANNSDVSTPVATWNCDSSYGCTPTQSSAPGVVGTGSGTALWKWGSNVSSIPFASMTPDYATLKTLAQSSGLMLNPTSVQLAGVTQGSSFSSVGGTDQKGFHLVFNSNGTVSVYRVTGTTAIRSWHVDNASSFICTNFNTDYDVIASETLVGTYTPPSTCTLIYSEAKTWIDGTVGKKITLVANDSGAFSVDVVLHNNISYSTADGTVGLTAIAERNMVVPIDSPDSFSIRGIYHAVSGWFARSYYFWQSSASSCKVPDAYASYVVRNTFTNAGTIISASRPAMAWTSSGVVIAGYQNRVTSYDRIMAFQPPPFTAAVSTDYRLNLWREQ